MCLSLRSRDGECSSNAIAVRQAPSIARARSSIVAVLHEGAGCSLGHLVPLGIWPVYAQPRDQDNVARERSGAHCSIRPQAGERILGVLI